MNDVGKHRLKEKQASMMSKKEEKEEEFAPRYNINDSFKDKSGHWQSINENQYDLDLDSD